MAGISQIQNISASWNSNSNANISSVIPSRLHHDKVDYIVSDVYKFIFGGIAGVSFLGNLFLCVVMCKNRLLLSKTYNLLLLNLAITDMLTGKYGRAFITRIVTELCEGFHSFCTHVNIYTQYNSNKRNRNILLLESLTFASKTNRENSTALKLLKQMYMYN